MKSHVISLCFLYFCQFSLTPLHLACWYGQESVVRLLLEHGANVNAVDRVSWLAKLNLFHYLVSLFINFFIVTERQRSFQLLSWRLTFLKIIRITKPLKKIPSRQTTNSMTTKIVPQVAIAVMFCYLICFRLFLEDHDVINP